MQEPELLAYRPEARAFKIEDLMLEITLGRLRIPTFQRRLAWDRSDSRKLVDSLYRGYPVGTLLFWQTSAPADQWRWGALEIRADERQDAWLVVDGQQRLVSLARVLLTSDTQSEDFALYFDLDSSEFVFPPSQGAVEEDASRWLPLNRVLDSEKLFEWLYEKEPSKERRERALQLGKRLREYDIPAYIVRSESEGTLREIFGRLNSMGKRLEASEVFDALNGARNGQRPSTLSQMALELMQSTNFGRLDDDILYRLLRVLHGVDVIQSGRDDPLRLDGALAESLYTQTEHAVRLAMDFISRDAGIPHYLLLPYKQPLVTLGKFFHFHPEPKPRSRELLVRWIWRGALTGAHRGDSVSTRTALDHVVAGDEEGSVQRMLAMVGRTEPSLPQVQDRFHFRYAASKLQALALLDLAPRDLESGEVLDIASLLNYREEKKDPPYPTIIKSTADMLPLLLTGANRIAHPNRPGLRKAVEEADMAILASHGIQEPALRALQRDDLAEFLKQRARHLQTRFAEVFARQARWQDSDRPSIGALVITDES
ncbi:DUF262 domain-containing protein [Acidovorax sp. SUPP3334]|uniref:DUF262 domain-containing protein n=1 Tax=Acidovorax sp. SUPP3334 TaxID=2920881 RepID=UPI0023DE2AF6|nr:DUF262 domain-containing protein [Acidovorax sp. SUPP3334]GKT20845.1 DUF262 domain-containing protein [Acidovorax sp. SUPP3334]